MSRAGGGPAVKNVSAAPTVKNVSAVRQSGAASECVCGPAKRSGRVARPTTNVIGGQVLAKDKGQHPAPVSAAIPLSSGPGLQLRTSWAAILAPTGIFGGGFLGSAFRLPRSAPRMPRTAGFPPPRRAGAMDESSKPPSRSHPFALRRALSCAPAPPSSARMCAQCL